MNWSLLEDNHVIIDNKKVECSYIKEKKISYIENKYNNEIDLLNKIYIRECDEYKILLDFNKKEQVIILKDKDIIVSSKIDGYMNISNNIINLKYNNGDSEKEIVVELL